jgi:3,4-dihydroxyphenylacetate 2,3-dioxygenase
MGEIVGAGFLSHIPPIMLPKETRLELNDGREISLVPGLKRLRSEIFDTLRPDTVIVFDSHWFSLFEFIITSHKRRKGIYTSEEVPRGLKQIHYDMAGNPDIAVKIADTMNETGVRATAIDDPYLPVNYATVNVAHYLNQGEQWLSVSICQTAQTEDFLDAGAALGEAVDQSGERVVLIGSGSLSHRFWPMKELDKHEASDPKHVITPEARAADEQRISWWEEGNHAAVIDTMDEFLKFKPEAHFGPYLMMVAAIGGRKCITAGRRYSDYENAIGTGQIHMWFDRPESGWYSN